MRELADISLFMKNCGQDGGSASGMASFNPAVSVHNNEAGVEFFFKWFGEEGFCYEPIQKLCDSVMSGGPVDDKAVKRLGTELGKSLAKAFQVDMYKVTADVYREYWEKDPRTDGPWMHENTPAERNKVKPLESDKLRACLELKDIEPFAKRMISSLPEVVAQRVGSAYDAGSDKLCREVGTRASAVFQQRMRNLAKLGNLATKKQKEYAAERSPENEFNLYPAQFPLTPIDITSPEDIKKSGLNPSSLVQIGGKYYFHGGPADMRDYARGENAFSKRVVKDSEGNVTEEINAWVPPSLGDEKLSRRAGQEVYTPPVRGLDGLDAVLPALTPMARLRGEKGLDTNRYYESMAGEMDDINRSVHEAKTGSSSYGSKADGREAARSFAEMWPYLAEGYKTDAPRRDNTLRRLR